MMSDVSRVVISLISRIPVDDSPLGCLPPDNGMVALSKTIDRLFMTHFMSGLHHVERSINVTPSTHEQHFCVQRPPPPPPPILLSL